MVLSYSLLQHLLKLRSCRPRSPTTKIRIELLTMPPLVVFFLLSSPLASSNHIEYVHRGMPLASSNHIEYVHSSWPLVLCSLIGLWKGKQSQPYGCLRRPFGVNAASSMSPTSKLGVVLELGSSDIPQAVSPATPQGVERWRLAWAGKLYHDLERHAALFLNLLLL